MHKIQAKEFTLEDFSCEHLFVDNMVNVNLLNSERGDFRIISNKQWLIFTCDLLNDMRRLYLETKNKTYWWQMIQLLPSSYNQRRTVQLNYEVLSHIYFDRKDHKLDEWKELCAEIRTLPYAQELITGEQDSDEEDVNSVDIKKENEELKKRVEFLENFVNSYTPGLNGF